MLRTILLAYTLSFAASAALAQTAQTPQPKPIKRGVASFWTSPEPTFDEGTYDRINAAMLSYSALEVRGGWPQVAKVNLAPGASGPDVAKLRAAPRRHRGPAGRGRRGRRLRHDADRSREALPGAPRPARDRHGRPADHRGAQRSGEDPHPPAVGLARPALRHELHLRPALRGGEHSGRGRRGGRGRQGRAALRHGGRQGRSPVADADHAPSPR